MKIASLGTCMFKKIIFLSLSIILFSFYNTSAMRKAMAIRATTSQQNYRSYSQISNAKQYRQRKWALTAKQMGFGALGIGSGSLATLSKAVAPLIIEAVGSPELFGSLAITSAGTALSIYSGYKIWQVQQQKKYLAEEEHYYKAAEDFGHPAVHEHLERIRNRRD